MWTELVARQPYAKHSAYYIISLIFCSVFIEGMIHRQIAGPVRRPWVLVGLALVLLFSMVISMLSVAVTAHLLWTLVCIKHCVLSHSCV